MSRQVIAVVVVALTSGCVAFVGPEVDRGERAAAIELDQAGRKRVLTPQQRLAEERDKLRNFADDYVTGRIARSTGEALVIEPYITPIASVELAVDPYAPVFGSQALLSRDVLRPGVEVRAYYSMSVDGMPTVVSIELVDEAQAAQLWQRQQNAPPPPDMQ